MRVPGVYVAVIYTLPHLDNSALCPQYNILGAQGTICIAIFSNIMVLEDVIAER